MNIFGIAGWSGSGKTTLILRLIPALTARGLRVATCKHSHHDLDWGDTEMRALRDAGAGEVLAASPHRFALVHEGGGQGLSQLTGLPRADLLLVEGFKSCNHPRLLVWDGALGHALEISPGVVAVAAHGQIAEVPVPVFGRDEVAAIADFVIDQMKA